MKIIKNMILVAFMSVGIQVSAADCKITWEYTTGNVTFECGNNRVVVANMMQPVQALPGYETYEFSNNMIGDNRCFKENLSSNFISKLKFQFRAKSTQEMFEDMVQVISNSSNSYEEIYFDSKKVAHEKEEQDATKTVTSCRKILGCSSMYCSLQNNNADTVAALKEYLEVRESEKFIENTSYQSSNKKFIGGVVFGGIGGALFAPSVTRYSEPVIAGVQEYTTTAFNKVTAMAISHPIAYGVGSGLGVLALNKTVKNLLENKPEMDPVLKEGLRITTAAITAGAVGLGAYTLAESLKLSSRNSKIVIGVGVVAAALRSHGYLEE